MRDIPEYFQEKWRRFSGLGMRQNNNRKCFRDLKKRGIALIAILFLMPDAYAAEWKATENFKYYNVTGTTGPELYKSIGQNGPVISGSRRTIAVTNWDLKWRRNYQPEGNACKLVSALPFVTITYTLPKPAQKLSGTTAQKWQVFAKGIKAHEKIHGDYVKRLAQQIIAVTVGLRVENDKVCKKIRHEVLSRVEEQFARYKSDNSAFEQSEMRKGGNIEELILNLVN